jgi:hypothetical protein
MNHEVHEGHEVRQKIVLGFGRMKNLNFVYFVNFVVREVLL